MAKRWVIGGLAVGVGALVLAPEARTWLRRRLGLEPEDRRWFEEEGVETAEHEGDEPLDTREARFSLRARLAEEGHAEPEHAALFQPTEPAPEPSHYAPVEQPAPDLALAEEPVSDEPVSEEPAAEEPAFEEPAAAEEPPAAEEPAAEEQAPEPEPRPMWPSAVPSEPEPEPSYASYETLPAITPEADEPRAPGEDTNEIDPLPSTSAPDDPAEEEAPPPPPTLLRPPSSFPPSRPFSGEGASFRSAIDAARERVHGAAREATPDDDEGDNSEPIDERA